MKLILILARRTVQSSQDNKKNVIDIESADDRILNCCLQWQSKGGGDQQRVWMLSNDCNLRTKALASKVDAFTRGQFADKVGIVDD